MKTETELIQIAEQHIDDDMAKTAMQELRARFDPTYFWCDDCDGLVCKKSECCLERIKNDDGEEIELTF